MLVPLPVKWFKRNYTLNVTYCSISTLSVLMFSLLPRILEALKAMEPTEQLEISVVVPDELDRISVSRLLLSYAGSISDLIRLAFARIASFVASQLVFRHSWYHFFPFQNYPLSMSLYSSASFSCVVIRNGDFFVTMFWLLSLKGVSVISTQTLALGIQAR